MPELDALSEALDCLTHPEHRLKYWLDGMTEAKRIGASRDFVDFWSTELLDNLVAPERVGIGRSIGVYNRKFGE